MEHYENNTELSKGYWTIKRRHFTTKITWSKIRKFAPFNATKKNLSQWKVRNSFIQRRQFIEQKVRRVNLIVDTKISSAFNGKIARTRSYVFTEIFLAEFPWRIRLWPAWLINVLHNMIFKTKIEHLKTGVSLENIVGNISCEYGAKMTSPFHLDTIKADLH